MGGGHSQNAGPDSTNGPMDEESAHCGFDPTQTRPAIVVVAQTKAPMKGKLLQKQSSSTKYVLQCFLANRAQMHQ